MPIEKFRPSFTLTQDRLQQLAAVVPEAFADGKVNWDTLKAALGEAVETGEMGEQFGLFWPGKNAARQMAGTPVKKTQVPALGEGVNEADTHHIFIDGDNLEALKLLHKSYNTPGDRRIRISQSFFKPIMLGVAFKNPEGHPELLPFDS
jgi:hypothetical protein